MKKIILSIILVVSFVGHAQVELNDYKYIIVPKRFGDFKKENQYRTSTLVKHLFEEKGFIAVYNDDLPAELNNNKCLGLLVDLIDGSSMFTTKASLVLKDCAGKEVFVTQEGKSKEKDYQAAFSEAIRKAFSSFEAVNYTYNGKKTASAEESVTLNFKNDVKTMDDNAKRAKNEAAVIKQEATLENQSYKDHTPVASTIKKAKNTSMKMVEQEASKETQSFVSKEPMTTNYEKGGANMNTTKKMGGVLYAQELLGGYQLVDSTPKIQLRIYKSSMPNVYIAKGENKDGVVYTSDGKWFFEYRANNQMVVEELNIKF